VRLTSNIFKINKKKQLLCKLLHYIIPSEVPIIGVLEILMVYPALISRWNLRPPDCI